MLELPYDCWECVLSNICDANDLARISCVNTTLRKAAERQKAVKIHINGSPDVDLLPVCQWLLRRMHTLKELFVTGHVSMWASCWRHVNFSIATALEHVTLANDATDSSLHLSSIEDFAPIAPHLQTLNVVSVSSIVMYPAISRYPLRKLSLICPLIYTTSVSCTITSLQDFCMQGRIANPQSFRIPPNVEGLSVPSSILPLSQSLPCLKRLRVYWDGIAEPDVDDTLGSAIVADAPALHYVELVGGLWTTKEMPQSVHTIRLSNGTITSDEGFSVEVGNKHIVLQKKRRASSGGYEGQYSKRRALQ
jgi:hypothetical protein